MRKTQENNGMQDAYQRPPACPPDAAVPRPRAATGALAAVAQFDGKAPKGAARRGNAGDCDFGRAMPYLPSINVSLTGR
jgi:hypothetical protein